MLFFLEDDMKDKFSQVRQRRVAQALWKICVLEVEWSCRNRKRLPMNQSEPTIVRDCPANKGIPQQSKYKVNTAARVWRLYLIFVVKSKKEQRETPSTTIEQHIFNIILYFFPFNLHGSLLFVYFRGTPWRHIEAAYYHVRSKKQERIIHQVCPPLKKDEFQFPGFQPMLFRQGRRRIGTCVRKMLSHRKWKEWSVWVNKQEAKTHARKCAVCMWFSFELEETTIENDCDKALRKCFDMF